VRSLLCTAGLPLFPALVETHQASLETLYVLGVLWEHCDLTESPLDVVPDSCHCASTLATRVENGSIQMEQDTKMLTCHCLSCREKLHRQLPQHRDYMPDKKLTNITTITLCYWVGVTPP